MTGVSGGLGSAKGLNDEETRQRKRVFFERTMQRLSEWLNAELFPDESTRPTVVCWSLNA